MLLQTGGQFKRAHEHLEEALCSAEGAGSVSRLDRDRRRLGILFVRMGRWEEAGQLLRASYESARDLRTLENRLASQFAAAELQALRGVVDEARGRGLGAMEELAEAVSAALTAAKIGHTTVGGTTSG